MARRPRQQRILSYGEFRPTGVDDSISRRMQALAGLGETVAGVAEQFGRAKATELAPEQAAKALQESITIDESGQKVYGEIPTFKAGANFGRVMVAEVGYLKKEIAYHGDTINTAARIRGMCHQYGKDFLISGVLRDALNGGTNYVFESQGIAELKGKESKVEIFSVERSG